MFALNQTELKLSTKNNIMFGTPELDVEIIKQIIFLKEHKVNKSRICLKKFRLVRIIIDKTYFPIILLINSKRFKEFENKLS